MSLSIPPSSDDSDLFHLRRADGVLTVIVINLSDEEQIKAIRVENQAPGGGVAVRCESQSGKYWGDGYIQWRQGSTTIHDAVYHPAKAIK